MVVTAFVTPGNARFLLLHDGRSDDSIRAFFMEVYELYLRVSARPYAWPCMQAQALACSQALDGTAAVKWRMRSPCRGMCLVWRLRSLACACAGAARPACMLAHSGAVILAPCAHTPAHTALTHSA